MILPNSCFHMNALNIIINLATLHDLAKKIL